MCSSSLSTSYVCFYGFWVLVRRLEFLVMSRFYIVSFGLFYILIDILKYIFHVFCYCFVTFSCFLCFVGVRWKRIETWSNQCILMHWQEHLSSITWKEVESGVDRSKRKWIRSGWEHIKAVLVEACEVRTTMEQLWYFGHNSLIWTPIDLISVSTRR